MDLTIEHRISIGRDFNVTIAIKSSIFAVRDANFKIPVGCLLNFHPREQPVLWSILVAPSILYTALTRIHENTLPPYIKSLK
jgi:hypothetical protein